MRCGSAERGGIAAAEQKGLRATGMLKENQHEHLAMLADALVAPCAEDAAPVSASG